MRLMTWNISRFTRNTLTRNDPFNEFYIADTVYGQALDIFIVIEVQTAHNRVQGQTIAGNGATGVLELLQILRNRMGAPDWRVVPPLKLASGLGEEYNEGIAVFYNNTTLDFVGPNWVDAQGRTTPNVLQAAAAYPVPWNAALPGGNNRAGKVTFTHYQNGNNLNFPNDYNRRPFYTQFVERGGALRNIKLISAHFPPNQADAARALSQLKYASEVRNVGANDVVIVAGDFNFNLAALGQNHVNDQNFLSFLQLFLPAIFNLAAGPTRIRDTNAATPQGMAPGYGYSLNEYLDNVFVRYGGGLAAPPHNPLVVNRVLGNLPNYPCDMTDSIPSIQGMHNLTLAEQNDLFREEWNYAHIARGAQGVSDHLPLVLDI